jgi:hypothetical protein
MSELVERLTSAAAGYKGTDLGGLLQWAATHIQSQDEALAETRDELAAEHSERIRMEQAIHSAKMQLTSLVDALAYSRPVNIELTKDHAPHINIMAYNGIDPYAKKSRKRKEAA